MIIHIVHGYAHRILNNGVVESAPVLPAPIDKDILNFGPWLPRTPESMNHTGGDMALIQEMLERQANLFPPDYRLPNVREEKSKEPQANEPR